MSEPSFVTASGRPFDLADAQRKAAEQAKRTRASNTKARTGRDHEDFLGLGFRVEGLTHAMLADARNARQKAIDDHPAACALAEAENRALPQQPLPFDEEQWRHTAKRVKVAVRPYEIRSAAEQCRELALKQGWLLVSVVEVRRERKS